MRPTLKANGATNRKHPLPRGSHERLRALEADFEKRRMSKVRINDLAREMEVKSRQILDILAELGLGAGKTHSSSLESDEAERFARNLSVARGRLSMAPAASPRAPQAIAPKIDLSHISKPGDVLKAILAKKRKTRKGRATRTWRQRPQPRRRRRLPQFPRPSSAA